ncbi:hypothetical protein EJB05_53999, partial [Eragrostis curvula]
MVTRHRDLHVRCAAVCPARPPTVPPNGSSDSIRFGAGFPLGRCHPTRARSCCIWKVDHQGGSRMEQRQADPKRSDGGTALRCIWGRATANSVVVRSHFPPGAMVGQSCRIRWSASSFVVTQQHPREGWYQWMPFSLVVCNSPSLIVEIHVSLLLLLADIYITSSTQADALKGAY